MFMPTRVGNTTYMTYIPTNHNNNDTESETGTQLSGSGIGIIIIASLLFFIVVGVIVDNT